MFVSDINEVKNLLDNNEVIAVKTDTVYGLVGKAFCKEVEESIYSIKGRDKNKPLILFIKNVNETQKYVEIIPEIAIEYMKSFWPGALTIIFKQKKNFNYYLSKDNTIGIRIPNEENILKLLNLIEYPLISTSANISGQEACMSAKEVERCLGKKVKYIWDNGELKNTKASTVIDVSNNRIKVLRHGGIKIEEK